MCLARKNGSCWFLAADLLSGNCFTPQPFRSGTTVRTRCLSHFFHWPWEKDTYCSAGLQDKNGVPFSYSNQSSFRETKWTARHQRSNKSWETSHTHCFFLSLLPNKQERMQAIKYVTNIVLHIVPICYSCDFHELPTDLHVANDSTLWETNEVSNTEQLGYTWTTSCFKRRH